MDFYFLQSVQVNFTIGGTFIFYKVFNLILQSAEKFLLKKFKFSLDLFALFSYTNIC
jgi:hypothetical protein